VKFYIVLLIGILIFTGCGGSKDSKKSVSTDVELSGEVVDSDGIDQVQEVLQDKNITQVIEHNTTVVKEAIEQNTTVEKVVEQSLKTVTIYVHGYNTQGYKREGVYGEVSYDSVLDKFVDFTGLPIFQNYDKDSFTNVLAITPYYGNQPPSYYTEQDIKDIDQVTQTYGGGIPRYATIIAKFAKHIMNESGADKVNIISASMGSLVTRWLIEKDIEGLSSSKKIDKWVSIEGVIKGNYALSKDFFLDLVGNYFEKSVDTNHMSYDWVSANLSQNNPYYNDIRIGQISGTDSETDSIGLNFLLVSKFRPNDGYQLLRDTYFDDKNLTHTLFHVDHLGIKQKDGAYVNVASFLESDRRVKITLVDVTVDDIHEHINKLLNKNAEIVFTSEVFSPQAQERWNIVEPISERVYSGGSLKVHKYKDDGETRAVNQVIFDDYVLNGEKNLKIDMQSFEIDRSSKYNINELNSNTRTNLGEVTVDVPLKNGIYEIISDDEWRGFLKVEVI
jgi:hypothetical protein